MDQFSNEIIFVLTHLQWIKIIILIFALIVFDQLLRFYLQKLIQKVSNQKNWHFMPLENKSLAKSIGNLSAFFTWVLILPILSLPANVYHYLQRGSNIILTLLILRVSFCLIDLTAELFSKKAQANQAKFDDLLIPLLTKAAKTLIILVGCVFIGESLNFDMKGLIAGLGIGGVAVAFAAKDSLANIFGSITVLMDKPFRIGDNIKLDNGLTGNVIEVGLRSTRLRSPDESIITVPNGSLTNANINNFGMRKSLRFETQLYLDIKTSAEMIDQLCQKIKFLLKDNPQIRQDNYLVYFNNFLLGSFEIKIIVFFLTKEGAQEVEYRHQLLTDILKLAENLKISLINPQNRSN